MVFEELSIFLFVFYSPVGTVSAQHYLLNSVYFPKKVRHRTVFLMSVCHFFSCSQQEFKLPWEGTTLKATQYAKEKKMAFGYIVKIKICLISSRDFEYLSFSFEMKKRIKDLRNANTVGATVAVLAEVPDKRLISARCSQLGLIIHFTVSADKLRCLCVLLEHKGGFNVSINTLAKE